MRELVERSPRKSICPLFAEGSFHCGSVQRILKNDKHLFPYKIQSLSELAPEQKAWRCELASRIFGKTGDR